MDEELVETWQIHARIVLFLLEGIDPSALTDKVSGSGRTVAAGFAHLHNVRLMWLKPSAPDLMQGVAKVEKGEESDIPNLRAALTTSGSAIAELVRRGAATGKVKGFKPHAAGFVGYLIAHESFHLGKIDLMLRQSGHPVSDQVHYGMWEWGTR